VSETTDWKQNRMVATTEPLQMVHEYIVPGERNHRLETK